MVIFRFIGLFLIVLALMLLGADVVSTLEKSGGTTIRSLDQILLLLGADTTVWIQQQLPPLAASALLAILSWPGWAVLGVPGVLLGMLGAPARKKGRAPPPPPPPYRAVGR
jgi:hypothetical protein